jgi:protein subunit release factor A
LPSGKKIKKRMTAAERKEMSKPFNKMLSDAQKSKKGMSKKEFDANVKKGMAEDARIAKVKKENMEAAKKTVLSPKTQLRNKKSIKPKKFSGGGIALRGLGRAFTESKR